MFPGTEVLTSTRLVTRRVYTLEATNIKPEKEGIYTSSLKNILIFREQRCGVMLCVPVLGIVTAESAGLEAAEVLAAKLRLNPRSVLETGIAEEKEESPKEAGVDTCVVAAGVEPKNPTADHRKHLRLSKDEIKAMDIL